MLSGCTGPPTTDTALLHGPGSVPASTGDQPGKTSGKEGPVLILLWYVVYPVHLCLIVKNRYIWVNKDENLTMQFLFLSTLLSIVYTLKMSCFIGLCRKIGLFQTV